MKGIRTRAGRSDERGSTIVEAVLIIPLCAIGAMVLMHVCMGLLGDSAAQAAARHGLLAATAYQGSDSAGRTEAAAYVHAVAPRFLPDPRVEVTRTDTTVTVHHALAPLARRCPHNRAHRALRPCGIAVDHTPHQTIRSSAHPQRRGPSGHSQSGHHPARRWWREDDRRGRDLRDNTADYTFRKPETVAMGRQLVAQTAAAASRDASLSSTPAQATLRAQRTAATLLTGSGPSCAHFDVRADTREFRPGGQISVTVTCTADLKGLSTAGLPATWKLTSTSRTPLDRFRVFSRTAP
jgi:Flp pilus assembly protein TadG